MSSDILHAYGGYIIVKNEAGTHSIPVGIYAIDYAKAAGKVMQDAKRYYPESIGWHSHLVGLVEFSPLPKEDK